MKATTLVIGYGNTLRDDDGAGVRAAERIAELHHDVDVVTMHELTPELAEKMAGYDRVVFIDASVNAVDVEWRTVRADDERSDIRSHALTPQRLTRLCVELYESAPTVELVEIPASEFVLSERLSAPTEKMITRCVRMFEERMLNRQDDMSPRTT
jgi:hydrogenase maturation protease